MVTVRKETAIVKEAIGQQIKPSEFEGIGVDI
jgi:hypothetical protein